MKKYISIEGILEVDESFNEESVLDSFLEWVESKGHSFGGGVVEVNEEGEPIKK